MDKPRKYEAKYKQEAVKLAKEVGAKKASEELKIPYGTLYDWVKKERKGAIETGEAKTPAEAMSLAEEIQKLRKENKEQAKEIKRLTEMNEFLEEASAFFAARRQKSGKSKD
ncbi:MAG: transposase [Oscillospiraceae bacterium]|nr:transposase [Oscillospiraceae bacterium]